VASTSRDRRAGELLSQGVAIGMVLGHVAEAVDAVPLLASVARTAHLDTPAINGLAAMIEGRIEPERWTATVTQPTRRRRGRPVRAA
jgi:glycerol-3-phosphate dehydrogenase